MHAQVNGVLARRALAIAALCALFSVLWAPLAGAQDLSEIEEKPELRLDDQWIPSFAIVSGVTWQEQKAEVESADLGSGTALRDPDTGKKDQVTPYVGINIELMTPAVEPGEPRLFANFEFLPQFGVALDIASEGNPKEIIRPAGILNTGDCSGGLTSPLCVCPFGFGCYDEAEIQGLGSKTTAEVKIPTYAAAIGAAFPFELFGRRVNVKPSIGWFRYRVKVDGKVLDAIKPEPKLPDVREIRLRGGKTRDFDAIGPGIEIEMEVQRQGPIEPTLFFDAHAYRVIGDRRVDFSRTEAISGCDEQSVFGCGIPDSTYTADWRWKADPWLYRFGIGLRFRWIGD